MLVTVRRAPRRTSALLAVVSALALLFMTACTAGSSMKSADAAPTEEKLAPAKTSASVTTNVAMEPAAGSTDVNPVTPVTLTAQDGILSDVVMTNEAGEPVEGTLSPDLLSWTSAEPLGYAKTYNVTANTTSVEGVVKPFESQIQTLSPANLTAVSTIPSKSGQTFGVGMPLIVKFDEPINDKAKAEQFMTVTTSNGTVGAWYWFSDKEAHWRPKDYYQPGTVVTLDVKIFGQDLGGGLYGEEDRQVSFTIGDSMVSEVSDIDKQLRVYKNGSLVKTFPASLGMDKYPSQSGVHVVQEKYEMKIMDSSTWGLPTDAPDGYYLEVPWATRISMSGEFVHAAPWSVADQGVRNTSHGCIGISMENGQWFYENATYGDIVVIKDTTAQLKASDGWGDWNIPWDEWQAGGKK